MSTGMPICYSDSNVYFIEGGIGGNLLHSTNNGNSWNHTEIGNNSPVDLFCDSATVYVSTSNGILTSSDNGYTWNYINNYGITERGVDLIEFSGNNILEISPSYNREANVSNNDGDSWLPVVADTSSQYFISMLALNEKSLITGVRKNLYEYYLYRSDDNGINWYNVNDTPVYEMVSKDSEIFAVGDTTTYFYPRSPEKKLMKSVDEGNSWALINKGISGYKNLTLSNGNLFSVKFGYYTDTLQKSTDDGKTWLNIFADSVTINSAAQIDSNIFIATSKNPYSSLTSRGLFYSSDYGRTWTNIFPDTDVISLISKGTDLIIATYSKIYRTSDFGNTFTDISDGFYGNVNRFKVRSPYLYAAASTGIWKRLLSEITSAEFPIDDILNNYQLFQNYPNPFNPTTIINYQIPKDGLVTLKIYDVLGREVKTLVNEQKTTGRYEVKFDADGLASGVYIYQIKVNDFTSSKKMLLLR